MESPAPSTIRVVAGIACSLLLSAFGSPCAKAQTIAVFTKNQNSPIFAALARRRRDRGQESRRGR